MAVNSHMYSAESNVIPLSWCSSPNKVYVMFDLVQHEDTSQSGAREIFLQAGGNGA